jgi:hypothetical protein
MFACLMVCRWQVIGGRAVEKSGGAVCGLHLARGDLEREFLG